MTQRRPGRSSHRPIGAALVLAAAGGVGAWGAQHRAVLRSKAQAVSGADAEQLELPEDVVHHEVVSDDGARIHVVERGRGPTLLLLHGMLLSSDIWAHQFTDLADRHRVVAVDMRGHGRSTVGTGGLGLGAMAGDVRAVVEALDLRDCLLVGHSMGGMVALQLTADMTSAERHDRFCGLAMVSSAAGPLLPGAGWAPVQRLGVPAWSRSLLLAERAGSRLAPTEDLRWWMVRLAFGPEPSPAQVRFVEQLHQEPPTGTLSQLVPALAGLNLSKGLAELDLPVLVVVGTRDRLIGPRHARRMAAAMPYAQLVELPRCGHMPMLERRHEFSRLLEEFCAKLG